jgi:hypothetical protein
MGQLIGTIEFLKGFLNLSVNLYKLDKLMFSFKFFNKYSLVSKNYYFYFFVKNNFLSTR